MIMMFKLRTANDALIGPSLLLYIKITRNPGATCVINPTTNPLQPSEAELIALGQSLSGEGYGELRRCLNVIDTLKGNVEASKQVLGQIVQTEYQLEMK